MKKVIVIPLQSVSLRKKKKRKKKRLINKDFRLTTDLITRNEEVVILSKVP